MQRGGRDQLCLLRPASEFPASSNPPPTCVPKKPERPRSRQERSRFRRDSVHVPSDNVRSLVDTCHSKSKRMLASSVLGRGLELILPPYNNTPAPRNTGVHKEDCFPEIGRAHV